MTGLPDPLTPADCNLRGMPFMPLDTERLLDSDMMALSTGEEFKTALRLWCKSWNQEPAASLPDDDRILAHLAGKEPAAWRKVKDVALRGFIKCGDGRLYHPVIAEKALEAWGAREAFQAKKEGDNDRKKEEREDRRMLFAALRDIGVILPAKGTPTSHLRKVAASHGIQIVVTEGHKVVTVTPGGSHKESHSGVTAKTGTGTGTVKEKGAAAAPPPRAYVPAPAHEDPPPAAPPGIPEVPVEPQEPPATIPDEAPRRATQIAVLLRRNGADPRTLPNDRRIADWARDGVADAEVLLALETAKERRKAQGSDQPIGTAYLAPIIADLRAAPPETGASKPAAASKPWPCSWSGIVAKGAELGLAQGVDELAPEFKVRVFAAADLTDDERSRLRADYGVSV
ncbi:DUF1376 domain-containing protein [uncultured Castellaniella sp.]|uniref:DUF1376 domain-containing protein n=1 Tax=uncultured Castellaniella sp. TaxID=647907 RepID=UPI0026264310|nr:DUF1376 domain-containing protein [uncultured Castellaniella sp.]